MVENMEIYLNVLVLMSMELKIEKIQYLDIKTIRSCCSLFKFILCYDNVDNRVGIFIKKKREKKRERRNNDGIIEKKNTNWARESLFFL